MYQTLFTLTWKDNLLKGSDSKKNACRIFRRLSLSPNKEIKKGRGETGGRTYGET
jgi:hypothetical protein